MNSTLRKTGKAPKSQAIIKKAPKSGIQMKKRGRKTRKRQYDSSYSSEELESSEEEYCEDSEYVLNEQVSSSIQESSFGTPA